MRSTSFVKLAAIAAVAMLLALSGLTGLTAQAGPLAQQTTEATETPTAEATAAATETPPAAATEAATETATAAATAVATRFPPCPPADDTTAEATATETATEAATTAATEAATVAATAEGTPEPFTPGYLGIAGETVEDCGTRVTEIVENGPAAQAGVEVGDVIVAVDGTEYRNVDDLRDFILSKRVGDNITLTVKRGDAELDIAVTLGERPERTPATVAPDAPTAEATAQPTTEATAGATAEPTGEPTAAATP